jgi:hypothetical protein
MDFGHTYFTVLIALGCGFCVGLILGEIRDRLKE